VFLTVALEEGKPVGAYAHEMALSRYVMTRYMQCIGDKGRNDRTGLGLVTVERSTGYPTRTEVFLTEKGRALFAAVLRGASFSTKRK
jgi:DNA-binding MarR family transcriptional regulator